MGDSFGSFQQALYRCIIVTFCLCGVGLLGKSLTRIHWRRDARWFILSFATSAFISGPLYYATLKAGIGIASALFYAGLILAMFFFGWLFSEEQYTRAKFVATVLAIGGLVAVFSPTLRHVGVLAMSMALMSGLASGLNITISQKIPYGATQSALIAWTLGIAANVAALLVLGQHFTTHAANPAAWIYLLLFSLTSLTASWCVVHGLKLIDAGSAGLLGLLEIVFSVLFGVIFFGERPGKIALLGIGLIIMAAAIPYIRHSELPDLPVEL